MNINEYFNNSNTDKELVCLDFISCPTQPILVSTGKSEPELVCPVCKKEYNKDGSLYKPKEKSKKSMSKKEEEYRRKSTMKNPFIHNRP